ncbi:hypothetical protein EC988_007993, partial [Linderina pennispora]
MHDPDTMPSPNASYISNAPTPPTLSETASSSSASTETGKRRSARHHCPRYLDNALTGYEVLEMLDEFIIDTDSPQRRKRRRRAPRAPKQTAEEQLAAEEQKPKKKKAAVRPRWYNQVYLIFLALRQSPGYTASRGDLVKRAVELDEKISKERDLPRAFTGRTPLNSASAVLTNNWDKHFVQFRPEGARSYHFKLAYLPGDFESALKEYEAWMQVLVEKDWPVCFGPDLPVPVESCDVSAADSSKQSEAAGSGSNCIVSTGMQCGVISNGSTVVDTPIATDADTLGGIAEDQQLSPGAPALEAPATISGNIPRTWQDIVE